MMVEAKRRKPRRGRRGKCFRAVAIVLACLCLLALVGGIAWSRLWDGSATKGSFSRTQEQLVAELNEKVEEGMFTLHIKTMIPVDSTDDTALLGIENVPANRYNLRVSITLDDTGKEVYRSGALRPGECIETASVDHLEPGTYAATATFTALNDFLVDQGHSGSKVTLSVN